MQPFFSLVERTGLVQRRVAALMGISEAHFTKVKNGQVPVTTKFRRQAVHALELLGVRDADGGKWTDEALFFVVTVDSDLSASVAEVA